MVIVILLIVLMEFVASLLVLSVKHAIWLEQPAPVLLSLQVHLGMVAPPPITAATARGRAPHHVAHRLHPRLVVVQQRLAQLQGTTAALTLAGLYKTGGSAAGRRLAHTAIVGAIFINFYIFI